MNVAGLVLSRSAAFACASEGSLFEQGTQCWRCGDEALPLLFRDWVKDLAQYDRVRLWNPRDLAVPVLYRLTIEACGDRLELVSPKQLRERCGLTLPTVRDYVELAKQRGGERRGSIEECIAVLLSTGDAGKAL